MKDVNDIGPGHDLISDKLVLASKIIINDIIDKHKMSFEDVIKLIIELRRIDEEVSIPLYLFKVYKQKGLGILETIVKYNVEQKGFSLKNISLMLNRDSRTIWSSYNQAKKKFSGKFSINDVQKMNSIIVPIAIFSNRKLGPLESLIVYLKEVKKMKNREIASQISRDNRVIWTIYSNAKKKI